MADLRGRTGPNRVGSNEENRLKHACDAGFLSGAAPHDTPSALDLDEEDSNNPPSSETESCDYGGESMRVADLTASFRLFSESLVRMEQADMEMAKAREASRCEAEKRRAELEAELTQMMLQTQLQIASMVVGKSRSRKRKRAGEEDDSSVPLRQSPPSSREGALLLSLLQCNLIF